MARPIVPRRDYYREVGTLTTMRNVVAKDEAHGADWRHDVRDHIEALIELLSRRPRESMAPGQKHSG